MGVRRPIVARGVRPSLGVLLASAILAAGPPAAAAGGDFPPGDEAFHTYAEVVAAAKAAADARPDLVSVRSIGTSYEGRRIILVKVSDNVTRDEQEPEVLLEALHHGREHMATEMALATLRWLVAGYDDDPRIRAIVASREIWIVPMVNPDGAEHDISGGEYRRWRKNRQPNAETSAIGTDLNRNYDYRWACCGLTSADPESPFFHGPAAFSAPETRALRDFVRSRVRDGRQQIRASISLHTSGRLVLYPYGYTLTDVPTDITRIDHRAFVAMAGVMAESNRYEAVQSSDLYVHSGTALDWLYARHRIFSFTFELSPPTRDYDPPEAIGPETRRNRDAVLYLLEQADCPYRAIGHAQSHCGPLYDDFEVARGWTADPAGTDSATAGRWERGDAEPTALDGPKQLGSAASGRAGLVTGRTGGACAACNDLDGGVASVRSRPVALPAGSDAVLRFRYSFAHDRRASPGDFLRVRVIDAASGAGQVVFKVAGSAVDRDAAWLTAGADLRAWRGRRVIIQFEASDGGAESLVEAAVDDVRVVAP